MAYLALNGVTVPVAPGGKQSYVEHGSRDPAYAGNTVISIVARKWRGSFVTSPLSELAAKALIAMLCGQGDYWGFENTLYSAKGRAPTASTGASFTTGKIGTYAVSLGATYNCYWPTTGLINGATALTMACWVKGTFTTSSARFPLCLESSGTVYYTVYHRSAAHLVASVGYGAYSDEADSGINIGDNTWHHSVGIFIPVPGTGNHSIELYIDGVLKATQTSNVSFAPLSEGVFLKWGWSSRTGAMLIDGMRLLPYAVSTAQIAAMYAEGTAATEPPAMPFLVATGDCLKTAILSGAAPLNVAAATVSATVDNVENVPHSSAAGVWSNAGVRVGFTLTEV